MRVPDVVRKGVVFLGRTITQGSQTHKVFTGTGFFVTVPSEDRPKDKVHIYLVTAKHVAAKLSLGDSMVRANAKEGSFVDIELEKGHKWWFHPTEPEKTDVAVTPVAIQPNYLDFSAVPVSMFVADEDVSASGTAGAGDEVFIVGLFNKMRGKSRNIPIVRTGNVAMIPEPGELVAGVKIGSDPPVEAEVYLIEARSIGGISGSPVFVRETIGLELPVPVRSAAGKRSELTWCMLPGPFHLLGLMHGHWDIDPSEMNEPDPQRAVGRNQEVVNLGIAVVVPAKKIKEALYQPELVSMRNAAYQEWLTQQGTTTPD